jgi:hypothetical protein
MIPPGRGNNAWISLRCCIMMPQIEELKRELARVVAEHRRATDLLLKQIKEEQQRTHRQHKAFMRISAQRAHHLGYLTEFALRHAVRERHGHQACSVHFDIVGAIIATVPVKSAILKQRVKCLIVTSAPWNFLYCD